MASYTAVVGRERERERELAISHQDTIIDQEKRMKKGRNRQRSTPPLETFGPSSSFVMTLPYNRRPFLNPKVERFYRKSRLYVPVQWCRVGRTRPL